MKILKKILLNIIIVFIGFSSVSFARNAGDGWLELIQESNRLFDKHEYTEAIQFSNEALNFAKDGSLDTNTTLKLSLSNLALLYHKTSQYKKSNELYIKELKILENEVGRYNIKLIDILKNIGLNYQNMGEYSNAKNIYEKILFITKASLGEKHLDTALVLNNLAKTYTRLGLYKEAADKYKHALKILKINKVKNDNMMMIHNNLAGVYIMQKKYTLAKVISKRSLNFLEKVSKEDTLSYGHILVNLAKIYEMEMNYEDAENLYRRALNIEIKLLGACHPSVAESFNQLALILVKREKRKEAKQFLEKGLKILKTCLDFEHPGEKIIVQNLKALE